MNERRIREKNEKAADDRHEALQAELRREQRARDTTEASLRKEMEDAKQMATKYSAKADQQNTELKGLITEEARNRGKNIEALLAEWAVNQEEIRRAIEGVRADLDRGAQDSERQAKGLVREAKAREAFEQFFGEKIHSVEIILGKFEGLQGDLDRRIDESQDAVRTCNAERVATHQDLRMVIDNLCEEVEAQKGKRCASPVGLPTRVLTTTNLSASATTLTRHPSPGPMGRTTLVQRAMTPPPGTFPMSPVGASGPLTLVSSPSQAQQVVNRPPYFAGVTRAGQPGRTAS